MYQKYPKVGSVVIADKFWTPYLDNVRHKMLPYVFKKFEEIGYVQNFWSVINEDGQKHIGPPFSDGLFMESLRGACDFLAADKDPLLEAYIDKSIEILNAAADKNDGFLCTMTTQNYPDKIWGDNDGDIVEQHDLYDHGTLIEAAISHYLATGKTTLLKTAVRAANLICREIGPAPKKNIIPGHSLPEEAFVKLYRLFRDDESLKAFAAENNVQYEAYLQIAEFWYEARGDHRGRFMARRFKPEYNQDHITFAKQDEVMGHSVRAMLCYLGATVVAQETGRQDYFDALNKLWDNMVGRKLHLSGGIGARYDIEGFGAEYHLPNRAYLETCAGIGLAFWNTEMNLVYQDAKYFDYFERSLYNNILSAVGEDFRHFFYQNPLQSEGDLRRWEWHGCPCCPPMLLKLFSAINSFIYAYDDRSVNVNMFIGSSYVCDRFAISQKENQIFVDSKGEKLTVKIRIPEYVENFSLLHKGERIAFATEKGYAVVSGIWGEEDPITVSYQYALRRVYANPKVEEDHGKVAVMHGPYVMCVEGIDHGGNVDLEFAEQPELKLCGENVYAKASDGSKICLIPYFKWCNRGGDENDAKMAVWLRQEKMRPLSELEARIGDKLYDTYA